MPTAGASRSRPRPSAQRLVFSATNDAQVLCDLMHEEGVTHSAGVPTVWLAMFAHMDATGIDYGKLQRVIIGGSAAPRAMIERFMKAGRRSRACVGDDRNQPDRHDGQTAVELG
jgi:acyl-CoA synthetase (AMP-forming)/AMP-acid ligase II